MKRGANRPRRCGARYRITSLPRTRKMGPTGMEIRPVELLTRGVPPRQPPFAPAVEGGARALIASSRSGPGALREALAGDGIQTMIYYPRPFPSARFRALRRGPRLAAGKRRVERTGLVPSHVSLHARGERQARLRGRGAGSRVTAYGSPPRWQCNAAVVGGLLVAQPGSPAPKGTTFILALTHHRCRSSGQTKLSSPFRASRRSSACGPQAARTGVPLRGSALCRS